MCFPEQQLPAGVYNVLIVFTVT